MNYKEKRYKPKSKQNTFNKIIVQNFRNLEKEMVIQVEEAF
jgi:hypothetical protein